MKLSYNLKLPDGSVLYVYDEKVSGGIMEKYVGPFDSAEKAKEYADGYTESYQMGYNGRGRVAEIDGVFYAHCSRWTSCD